MPCLSSGRGLQSRKWVLDLAEELEAAAKDDDNFAFFDGSVFCRFVMENYEYLRQYERLALFSSLVKSPMRGSCLGRALGFDGLEKKCFFLFSRECGQTSFNER